MEAETKRLSGGNDRLVLRALDDPRIVAWKQAWAFTLVRIPTTLLRWLGSKTTEAGGSATSAT
jgi:hypothetical protein